MSLSIIVPTIGRETLANTLLSILPQLYPEDEIIVSVDGLLGLYDFVTALSPQIRYVEFNHMGDYGNTARDRAISIAKGTHLAFCDDDDIVTPDALTHFRRAIKADSNSVWLFKMYYGAKSQAPGLILWADQHVRKGNIGTPCFLVPRRADLPNWANCKELENLPYSDFFYLTRVLEACYNSVDDVRWDSSVVCIVRPGKDELNV